MRLLVVVVALWLNGCQYLAYQPPESGETASLVFTSDGVAAQPMVCVPGRGFKATEYSLARQSSENESLADLNEALKKQATVEVAIPAGESLLAGVRYNKPNQHRGRDRCKVAVRFTPEAGARYQARFVMSGEQCGLSLTRDARAVPDVVLTDWDCR